jgi:hypothetical protein
MSVSNEEVEFFQKNGWLLTSTLVGQVKDMQQWVDEIAAWPVRLAGFKMMISSFSFLILLSCF